MKLKWVPFMMLISVLFGVILGIQIAKKYNTQLPSENTDKKLENIQQESQQVQALEPEPSENDSIEVLAEPIQEQPATEKMKEQSFFSKMGNSLDHGVTRIISGIMSSLL